MEGGGGGPGGPGGGGGATGGGGGGTGNFGPPSILFVTSLKSDRERDSMADNLCLVSL